jgi:hypothetical protein
MIAAKAKDDPPSSATNANAPTQTSVSKNVVGPV